MSKVDEALEKIRAAISKDCHIINHYIRNRDVVAVIAKKNVGTRNMPVSSCMHISIAM